MGDIVRTFNIPLPPNHARKTPDDNACPSQTPTTEAGAESLEITLHEPALTADNLGLKTWAAAYLLAKRLALLQSLPASFPPGARILELGAGTGLVGLAAAAIFQTPLLLTDLPDIVPNLQRNIDANTATLALHGGNASTAVLDWADPNTTPCTAEPNSFPLILSADPIYSSQHPALLVNAIAYHLSFSKDARVVIELPLREAFAAEREDLRARMGGLGLVVRVEGEEVGFDDWGVGPDGEEEEEEGERKGEVRCWWGVWGWG